MHRVRRRLKSFVWIALLAFVGLAVAPTVSRALHFGGAEPARANAHSAMAATAHHHHGHDHGTGSTESAPRPGDSHSLEHCAMCVVAAAAFALAATPPALAAHAAFGAEHVRPTYVEPGRRDDWSPATSRGPPAAV